MANLAMPSIIISPKASEQDHQFLLERLVSFNDEIGGASGYEPVAILIKADDGEPIGGLWGKISYDWLFVDILIVPKELRGSGFGAQLMEAAERAARNVGCVGVWLDTHGFQAPEFYRKLGYETFGELPDHPRGTSRHFFRKLLA